MSRVWLGPTVALIVAALLAVFLIVTGNWFGWILLGIDLTLIGWNLRLNHQARVQREAHEVFVADLLDDLRAREL